VAYTYTRQLAGTDATVTVKRKGKRRKGKKAPPIVATVDPGMTPLHEAHGAGEPDTGDAARRARAEHLAMYGKTAQVRLNAAAYLDTAPDPRTADYALKCLATSRSAGMRDAAARYLDGITD
jgi:hypothetical protein